jgi:hypothetical protein
VGLYINVWKVGWLFQNVKLNPVTNVAKGNERVHPAQCSGADHRAGPSQKTQATDTSKTALRNHVPFSLWKYGQFPNDFVGSAIDAFIAAGTFRRYTFL